MIHLTNLTQAALVCDALGSPVRRDIMELIIAQPNITPTELAKKMHLSGGAITGSLKILLSCGLIRIIPVAGKRGTSKQCVAAVDKLLIDLATIEAFTDRYEFDIRLGRYSECYINPYCAIATKEGFIGERDDPRYFTYPKRDDASLIYFRSGKLTWQLPNPLKGGEKATELSVSFELSSKHAGYDRKGDSEVTFYLCGKKAGEHLIGGEYNDRRGNFTPEWYEPRYGQYGSYKTLTCNDSGTFIDGIKIGAITINELNLSMPSFGLETHSGLAMFGEGFGDYGDIKYVIRFK